MEIDLFGNLIVEAQEEVIPKRSKLSPFDYTGAIADKKYPEQLDDYNPWIVNSAFSQRKDTVFYANELNKYHQLGNKEQFDFYYHSLPKKKYFAKWAKANSSKNLPMIMAYFHVSESVAESYERVLKKEELDSIINWYNNHKGGR